MSTYKCHVCGKLHGCGTYCEGYLQAAQHPLYTNPGRSIPEIIEMLEKQQASTSDAATLLQCEYKLKHYRNRLAALGRLYGD